MREVIDGLAGGLADTGFLVRWALALVGLALGIAVFRFGWRHFFFSLAHGAELDLRQRMLDHALVLSATELERTTPGELMALATNDLESVRRALAMGLVAGVDASLYAVVAAGALFWLDPASAAVAVLPLPCLALLMKGAMRAIYRRWDGVQSSFESLTERARETIAGARVLKSFAREPEGERRLAAASQEVARRSVAHARVEAALHPAILLFTGACTALLLGFGGARVADGRLGLGTFVAMISYLGMLTWPAIAMGWMLSMLQRASASMDRLQAFLARAPEDAGGERLPGPARGALEVRALRLSLPGAHAPVLDGIDFALRPGDSLGITGPVGSGKSVLLGLLAGLREPPPGAIALDGRDLAGLARAARRAAVAYVPQEAFLFSDTIEANLRLGDPDASPGELEQACRAAALHEEIVALPDGYQSQLGERGISLSGGQKQRLCLARALLKPAPVLLLDDTLSAVDPASEARIAAALAGRRGRQTLVVVSHRLSALHGLDRVAVLERGRLVQLGPPAALLQQPGPYRELARLQELEGGGAA
ncbi:MAG TPA: ABC transporter ATP-binding protein [Myxococcota bacterium]|nr:ABC transporter ATP-binding protein [Myxococcota bacterium]HRY95975.1 ABC transporter ATP-binding protein [Myxococcota bacterium]HSA22615.1 ABC transporter ATP-binding protein [Myxococcota bacterium]